MNKRHKTHKVQLVSTISREGILEMQRYISKPVTNMGFQKQKMMELRELTRQIAQDKKHTQQLATIEPDQSLQKYCILSNLTDQHQTLFKFSFIARQLASEEESTPYKKNEKQNIQNFTEDPLSLQQTS